MYDINKDELLRLIDETLQDIPERMTGNEANQIVSNWLRPLAFTNRDVLIEALRYLLSVRMAPSKRGPFDAIPESKLWLALSVAEDLKLRELLPDVESLLADTRAGKTLRPVHAEGMFRYIKALSKE